MGSYCCKAIYEKAIRSRFRHVSDATLARPSSPLIEVVPAASDSAAVPSRFPLQAPSRLQRMPCRVDLTQAPWQAQIAALSRPAQPWRDRGRGSSVLDTHRRSVGERSQDGGGPFSLATHILCKRRNRVERISG